MGVRVGVRVQVCVQVCVGVAVRMPLPRAPLRVRVGGPWLLQTRYTLTRAMTVMNYSIW